MTTSQTPGGVTDFSQYTLPQLSQMLFESDPATGTTTAQTWDATGKMLHEQASNLEGRLRHFDGEWTGTASDEYKRMVTDLIGGLRKVADTSLQMRDLTYDAVDSLKAARAAMPAPVDVPVVPPATLALATTPLPIDASTSPAAAAQMQADQARAVSAVQAQQNAISAADSAHAQAVAVMRTLADSYVVAQDRFPPTPGGAAPAVNGTGPGTGVGPNGTPIMLTTNGVPIMTQNTNPNGAPGVPGGPTVPGQNQGSSSLFGDMFTVGLAAAAAAAGGSFAGGSGSGTGSGSGGLIGTAGGMGTQNTQTTAITGKLTPVANPNAKAADADKHAAVDAAGVLGSRFLANKLGGKFGGGGGGGVSLGSVNADPNAAKAAADAAAQNLTAAETSVANDFTGGALGAGGAAAAAAGRGGMMPMMPMSGMAGAGMGGDANRRIPAWLVETEDVWGASAPVSPGVIGGDL